MTPEYPEFYYDYEFVFTDFFDNDIFDAFPLDASGGLKVHVITLVEKLSSNQLLPLTRCICAYTEYNGHYLKITLLNSDWGLL